MPYSLVGQGACVDKNNNVFSYVLIGAPNDTVGCDSYCQQNPISELVGFASGGSCTCYFSGGGLPNPLPTYNPTPIVSIPEPGNGPIDHAYGTYTLTCYRYDVSAH